MSIEVEQPPLSTDRELTNYLTRTINTISNQVSQNNYIIPQYILPNKMRVGELYYFGDAIAGDTIVIQEGLYIVKKTGLTFII